MAEALDRIAGAAALLAEQYPDVAEFMLSYPANLIEHLTGESNGVGCSARTEIVLLRRNELLRKLGERASPVPLAAELKRFYTDVWPRVRTSVTNPFSDGDRRSMLWAVLKLRPRPVSVRYLRVILN